MLRNLPLTFLILWLLLALQSACSPNNSPSEKADAKQTSATLHRIRVGGKYGYIDRTGRVVIPPQFERAEDFSEGLAAVQLDTSESLKNLAPSEFLKNKGYIDQFGHTVIPGRFTSAGNFSGGLALVNPDVLIENAVFINKSGKEVIVRKQFIGGRINSVSFENGFSEGLAAVGFHLNERGLSYGYIDLKGQIVIDPQYDTAFPFQEGVAEVYSHSFPYDAKKDVRGLIDRTGRMVADLRDLCPRILAGEVVFSEGLAPAKTSCFENAWGFIDPSGQFVIKPQFASASIFREDLAIVGYEHAATPTPDAGSDLDGLRILGDVTHQTPSAAGGNYLDGLRVFGDGGLNYPNMKYGYIHKSGVLVIPARFEGAGTFSEGLAAVKIGQKCGYIDKTGRVVIAAGFDAAHPFVDGIAEVRVGSRWGYIGKDGAYIWTPSE